MHRLTTVFGFAAACSSVGSQPAEERLGNPLGFDASVLPFPSAYYLVEDNSTPTGVRVDLLEEDLPHPTDGTVVHPDPWNLADGFSPSTPMIVRFDQRIDPANLPTEADPEQSLAITSPTVLVDMTTGERVLHFAEVDSQASDSEPQALLIRPMQWLARGRRYAVAITTALRAENDQALTPSAGFLEILDGNSDDPRLDRIRDRYADVFAALEAAGVPATAENLLLAFDTVTASEQTLQRDLLSMRDAALAFMGDTASVLSFTVDEVEENPAADTLRIIRGTYHAPLFLTGGPKWDSFGSLARDADGLPALQGVMDAPFTMVIPNRAQTKRPLPILQYGHGLMADSEEATDDWLRALANDYGYIVVAHNWMGLSEPDGLATARMLNNLNSGSVVFDRLKQGVINAIALTRVARFGLVEDETTWINGKPTIDSTQVYYYGNSQGGILGTSLMSYSTDILRGVLGVGGGNYSLMLQRSVDWPPYATVMEGVLPFATDQLIAISLMQMLWDPSDGISAAAHVLVDPYPGTPTKQILMQIGVGDLQVPNIASDIAARTMGIALLGPTVHDVVQLEPMDGPLESALSYWDYGFKAVQTNNVTGKDNIVHEAVRRTPAAQRQLDQFLKEGIVVQTCDGACDCTTAACD